MKALTRFDITQNPNMRKRAERTAVRYANFQNYSYVAEGIVHLTFQVEGEDVIFLDDRLTSTWLVSECNKYIVGSGVLNKIYRNH